MGENWVKPQQAAFQGVEGGPPPLNFSMADTAGWGVFAGGAPLAGQDGRIDDSVPVLRIVKT